ncbi:MAG TPA: phenylacetate--CoA ligase family protein, partial [Ktedonobacteraceae bacterium]|nr:phenylacetate--CoA ligase family protein [Ktedonobacteraceae bacterium]
NVYPSALANILHRFPEVTEYRVIITRNGPLDELALQVECPEALVATIQAEMHIALSLRIPIETVESGVLPRFELKAKRVVDRRPKA